MKTILQEISSNCHWHKSVNGAFVDQCEGILEKLQDLLPSGSGFDCGCKIDIPKSGSTKVVITFDYHHMNEDGYYTGWTSHTLTVSPTFSGFDMKISGRDRNQAKDYFYDTFSAVLSEELPSSFNK